MLIAVCLGILIYTVTWITRQWGIVSAILFACVVIIGAYILGSGGLSTNHADAISTDTLLQTLANKDSDHDGLPNWEEVLYGTNPYKADTFGLGMTDGEAVAKGLIVPKVFTLPNTATSTIVKADNSVYGSAPTQGSLTDIFAKNFFSVYLAQKELNKGAALSKQQLTGIVKQAMAQLNNQVTAPIPYRTISQIKIGGSGTTAMRTYAAGVQQAFSKHTISQDKGVLIYLQEAAQDSNTTAVAHIQAIADICSAAAAALAQMTVPTEVAQAHLKMINAYAGMASVINNLAKINTDPIIAMLALSQYKKSAVTLAQAFSDMGNAFRSSGVVLKSGEPGASFVNLMDEIAATQQQKL